MHQCDLLVKRIRVRDRSVRACSTIFVSNWESDISAIAVTVVIISDKVVTGDNLVSRAECAAEEWVCVVNTSPI